MGNDDKAHECVRATAIFCALAAEHSGFVRFKPYSRRISGNQIFLAMKIRRPKTVNYIRRSKLEPNGLAYGYMNFVCRCNNAGWAADQILHFPPPLMSRYLNVYRLRIRKGIYRPFGEAVFYKQCEKNDDR